MESPTAASYTRRSRSARSPSVVLLPPPAAGASNASGWHTSPLPPSPLPFGNGALSPREAINKWLAEHSDSIGSSPHIAASNMVENDNEAMAVAILATSRTPPPDIATRKATALANVIAALQSHNVTLASLEQAWEGIHVDSEVKAEILKQIRSVQDV